MGEVYFYQIQKPLPYKYEKSPHKNEDSFHVSKRYYSLFFTKIHPVLSINF
ncbi:Uncharacterised protein [Bergeyella zoohelcum]|uniref:Uncharacterized protein n=2 Tax=Bergeyella zoohelcum TaxID=1015 RepID=K1LXH9_9FLAO|nr:hypothetical protein HMPREF9699_00106 [Bergeyella zoohelcum ATCC 43767]SUV49716.1 Uncharacterised protein [Bergeyella zoohelcum]VDH04055.1 Uncharacterised protein [Bergeyella zoohelcum]